MLSIQGGERELTGETRDDVGAVVGKRVQEGLGIAVAREGRRIKLASEVKVVVDLTVVGEQPAPVRMAHRLVPAWAQIDDRQPCVHQADVLHDRNPRVVRPTMAQGVSHGTQAILRRTSPHLQHAASDAAHGPECIRPSGRVGHAGDPQRIATPIVTRTPAGAGTALNDHVALREVGVRDLVLLVAGCSHTRCGQPLARTTKLT